MDRRGGANPSREGFLTIAAYQDVAPEFELYNLTDDPTEVRNLAHDSLATKASRAMQQRLQVMRDDQRTRKCLTPRLNQGAPRAGGEGLIDVTVPPQQQPGTSPQAAAVQ